MTASDEEDSEFERFLQASLSSSSASNRSTQNVSQLKNVGVAGKGRGHSSYVPTSLSNQWLEEEEEALKWLKPTHRDGVPVTRESTGEGGGLKLEVSVPNTSLGTGTGGESISVTNNSDEFSKDSVEVSLDKTPTSTTTRPRVGDFQDTTATALLDQSSHSFVVDQSSRSLTGDDVTPRQSGSSESETETSEGESPVIKAGNELKLSPSPKQSAAQTISPLSEFTPVIKTINEAEAVKPLAKQWEIKLNTSQSTHGTACSKDRDLSPPIHSHSLTSSGISTTMSVKQLEQSRLTEKSILSTSLSSSQDLVSLDDGVCGRSEGEHELMKDGWGEEDGDITQGGKMTSSNHVDMEGVEDYKDEESFPHIPSIDSNPHTPNINNDIKSVGNLTSKHSESETITLSLPLMIVETTTVHNATQSTMPHNSDLNIMEDLSDDVCTTQRPPILTTPSNIETSPDRGGDITNKTADIQQMSPTDVPLHNTTPSLLLVQTIPSTESLQSQSTGAKSRLSIDRFDYKITTAMSSQPPSQTPTTVIDIHPPVTDNTHNVSCGGFLSIGGGERDSDAVDRMGESCEQFDSERLESEKVLSTQASEAHSVDDEVVNGVVMLEEAGDELERGLDELQHALDAAGLPGIHGNRQFNTHSNGRKNHGTSQGVLTLQDHSHSQQHMLDSRSHTRTKTNRKEDKNILKDEKLSISKQSSRLTDGENDGMDATLRALATEELTSITKDLMYRERRKESARRQNSESKTSLTTSKTRLTTDKTRLTTNKTSSLSHKTGLGHQKTSVTSSIPSFKSGRPISGSSSTSRKFCGRKLEPSTKDRVYAGRVSRREQDSDDGSHGDGGHGDGGSSHGDGSHGDGGSKGERIELETSLQNETESVAREKVQKYKSKQSLWQHVKVGGAITEGEMKELKSSIHEQESLIDGYQKENERLYAELKEVKHSLRLTKEQLTTDTQKLRTELANTRAQLELKPSQDKAATSGTSTNQTTSNNNDIIRITQLEDKLERSRDECRKLERQVVQLKHSLHVTEHRTSLSRNTIHKGTQTEGEEGREDGELKMKEAEIALLKDKLLAIQRRGVRKKASHTSSFDAERIQQLERQVRGLNDIIKRRFPNSLSALIIAAESSSSQTKTSAVNKKKKMVTGSTQSASRVREIEEEMKRKEEENKTKIEALHQKYTSMKIYYEEQLSSLRERLKTEERKNTAAIDLKNEPSERERRGSEREEEMQLPRSSPRRMTSEVVSSPTATRPEETIRTKEENVFLRQQLSSLQLEWEHQRLKLQSQLVEAEAASRTAREETAAELSSLRQRHVAEVDRLKAQFARHHSQSETATLKTNLSSLQVECHLMKERLKMAENEREELRAAKENEEVLTRQIKQLSKQLVEAKKHHTPEMHHYSSLLAKITTLETRIAESESTTSQRMERLRRPITDQMKQIELKWQRVVQSKDEEIAQFRVEMDTILQTLHALQINPSPYTS